LTLCEITRSWILPPAIKNLKRQFSNAKRASWDFISITYFPNSHPCQKRWSFKRPIAFFLEKGESIFIEKREGVGGKNISGL
jgi:hypothetical protein